MAQIQRVVRLSIIGLFLANLIAQASAAQVAQLAPSDDPQSVLRDAMMYACSQNAGDFRTVLTARNTEAFARMTPAARATLLKRFVLLDKPGEPRAENKSADSVVVFCVTPEVTTQMVIGKPELRDNLSFLALTVKDISDTTDEHTRHVVMGMVREHAQWKMLSLGLLLLDLPALEEEWDRAEIQTNERSAIALMKELAGAVESYRKSYTRLPETLAALGPAPKDGARSDKAGLVGEELAAGHKDGYAFRYVIVGANNSGAPAKYELAAIPIEYGRSGARSFFRDSNGVLRAADHQGAVGSAADPKLD